MRFWVGGDTAQTGGSASGIGELLAGEAASPLAGGPLGFAGTAATTGGSPSWLAAHPVLDVVYAALEGAGAVQAFRRVSDSRLVRHGAPVAVGELPCHVAVAPDGGSLIVACRGDGAVVRVGVHADGRLGTAQAGAVAADPYATEPLAARAGDAADAGDPLPAVALPEFSRAADLDLAAAARALREAAGEEYAHLVPDYDVPDLPETDAAAPPVAPPERVSRAHQARFLPGGLIATTETGFDAVRFWRVVEGSLRAVGTVRLPLGSGPRHTVWHPSGHLYVVTELSCEVFVLAPDESRTWRIVGGTPLSRETMPGDLAAELSASADGAFVYAGVRGSDTLATLRVRGAGEALAPVALSETGVAWPRHHVIARDTVLVAGRRSETVATLTLDLRTGVPGRPLRRVEVPSPTCLLPAR